MNGYHFHNDKLRDGREMPDIGEWLVHDGPIIPCKCGLHASEHPYDALMYAPGPFLDRVELDGELVAHGNPPDKWCGWRRRRIATVDATAILREFARWCAMQVIDLWDAPPVVREFLTTGDESLRPAARDAARAAARDAQDTWAGRAAARAAAWAARDTACPVWDTARDAQDAAWAAAWDAQREQFRAMVDAAFAAEGE